MADTKRLKFIQAEYADMETGFRVVAKPSRPRDCKKCVLYNTPYCDPLGICIRFGEVIFHDAN